MDLQLEAQQLLDAIGPLSDRDLNAIVRAPLGSAQGLRGSWPTQCVLEAVAIGRGEFAEIDGMVVPFWAGMCRDAAHHGATYDRLLRDNGTRWLDALRAEALSRITHHTETSVSEQRVPVEVARC